MGASDLLKDFARTMRDLAFPPLCVACGGLVEESGHGCLCPKCEVLLEYAEDPACTTCGHPFYGVLAGERSCPHCEGLQPHFDRGRTLLVCKGPARALVHELKYHRGVHVLSTIGRLVANSASFTAFLAKSVLVPVPLHPRKARERGFNQSLLLAQTFAQAVNAPIRVESLLQRKVDTVSQTAFDRRSRRANLKNAFALKPRLSINPSDRYILIDDVFTTGSTLNSCAGVLRRAGCLNLDVATFGHG